MKTVFRSLETRKRMSLAQLGKKASFETRKKMSLAQKGKQHTFETRLKISRGKLGDKNPAKRPEVREKISKTVSKLMYIQWQNPQFRLRMQKAHIGKKHSLETCQKISRALKGHSFIERFGIKKANQLKKIHRETLSKHRYYNKCINKFETRALMYINSLYNNSFKFCGDGSVLINKYSPDAIHKNKKIICLFNGTYWHLINKGLKVTDQNKRKLERKESKPFIDAGYGVLFIWEDELKESLLRGKKVKIRRKNCVK